MVKNYVTLLRRLARKAVDSGIVFSTRVTYVEVTSGAYDPATDTYASTITEHKDIPAILTGLRENEQDRFPADQVIQRAIIAYEHLPNVRPSNKDHLLIDDVRWNINRVRFIPGDPVYILYIREP